MRLVIYGKESCHLCDDAEVILRELGIVAEYVDIESEAVLLENYGIRIPVLKRLDTGMELGWPFDAEMVSAFVAL
ncbi:MAG: glutaredoxin family protein [Gammaproteobacteria bacterium]|nr:glutaredoxin family protein [Gammaproteobacteria bacterium]MBU1969108.1 glutaredoxin family protein [Gammaproteobacteria bacterium]